MSECGELIGLRPDLDRAIYDLSFLTSRYADFFPANTGDISWLIPNAAGPILREAFSSRATDWVSIDQLETLSRFRADGRSGYRAEGVREEEYYKEIGCLAGRMMLITRTGAMVPAISETVLRKRSGELLSIVELDATARQIRLLYGVDQYGSIPSIETHLHLLTNAISTSQGAIEAATVHAHPRGMICLGRHPRIAGDYKRMTAILLSQIEGLNRVYGSLVGIVPYQPSGSAALVSCALPIVLAHRITLLMNHGLVVRGKTLWECFALMSYSEESALAALDSLQLGALGLPEKYVLPYLRKLDLVNSYKELNLVMPPILGY